MLVNSECRELSCLGWGTSIETVDGRAFSDANVRNAYLLSRQFKDVVWLDECIYDVYASNVDGTDRNLAYNLYPSGGFILQDGMLFAMSGANLYVDVNGKGKGPNTQGRDIFLFYIDTEKAMVYGRIGWDMGRGYCMTDMSKAYTVWGSYCTKRVLDENAMNY